MKLMSEYLLIFMCLCGVAEASEQTLDVFLESAATLALDDREARATLAQREGEAMQSWGRLLPSFSVAGDYTRNQQAVTFELPDGTMGETRTITISARDQFDLTLSASVPLIDAQTWLRTAAQVASSDAARQRLSATALETERQVVRAYYVLVAAEAFVHSTRVALSAQEATAALTTERKEAGLAGELDTRRAAAEVAVARQNVSDALYSLAAARRTLRTLTGVTPNDQPHAANDAIAGTESRAPPSTVAAKLDVTAAKRNQAAAWLALAPTLSVKANERLTNAPGFSPNPFWSVIISARFTLDAVSFGNVRVQSALAEQAVVRAGVRKAQRVIS